MALEVAVGLDASPCEACGIAEVVVSGQASRVLVSHNSHWDPYNVRGRTTPSSQWHHPSASLKRARRDWREMLHGLYPKCFSPYLYLPFNPSWNWSDIYLLLLLRRVIRISNFITLLSQKPPNVLLALPSCGLHPQKRQPRVPPDASVGWNGIIFLTAELTFLLF